MTNYTAQTYNLSVLGKLYVGSSGEASYDLSTLFQSSDLLGSYFGDMMISLMSDQEFYDAVGGKLSANFNLGDLFLDYFTKNGYELISEWEAANGTTYTGTK